MSQTLVAGTRSYAVRQDPTGRTISPDAIALIVALLVTLGVTVWGSSYYFADSSERVRHPLHALLKPSGALGQGFGFLGLALFLFMWLYPIRKWIGARLALGSVATWMRIHTIVGLSLPAIVAVHAGWRFRGLIGLGYLAMIVVSLSGIVGRYLYGRIPRTRAGVELSRDEIAGRRRALVTEIAATLRQDPNEVAAILSGGEAADATVGIGATFRRLMVDDWRRWRSVRDLRQRWRADRSANLSAAQSQSIDRAVRLAREEIRLRQQLDMLAATQRVFRFWHVAHRPVSITALFAIAIHVGVAIAMGQTWFR